MNRPKSRIVLLLVLAVLAATASAADSPATRVVLATATQGGGFQLYGQHLADAINATDGGLQVEAIPTRGSRQNLQLLENGEADIGLVEGNAARQALDGIGRAPTRLKVLSVMYPNPGMFVVRADSPYQRIDDLKGKPVAFGTRASGLRILAGDVLDGLGLDPQRDFQQLILEKAADGPRLVLDGKAEALWGAGIGWPGFVKIAADPRGARFIAPSPEQIARILQRHPHLRPMSVPAGTYRGQQHDIDSVGLWSLVLTRADLPDALAYRLAQAIHRGERALAAQLAQGRYSSAANTVAQVAADRLHPGVARYLREAGLAP
jgi:TRAP transporter TAXI family solute receptor